MKKINEIFYSLQGEGYHTGTPAVFVRFSGCNLRCPFCDTQFESGCMMTDEAIVEEVMQYPATLVVLTGGEPSLFVDNALIDKLHSCGKYVAIETNGTHLLPDTIDWVTCSPKENSLLSLKQADEVKVVYQNQPVEVYRELISASHYFLQPCSCKNTQEVVDYIKTHPHWRLSLQTHKYIGIS